VNDNTIISIFGVKGSGKTTLVQEIAREHPRVFAFDTVGQYGPELGAKVVFGLGPGAVAMVEASRRERFFVSLRSDNVDDLVRLLAVAYEVTDSLVIVEEASFFSSPAFLPVELSQLVRLGRHRRISQVYVAQRPSEVHRAITAQSDLVVSFHQEEDRDLLFLKGRFGQRVEKLRTLQRYKVMVAGDLDKVPLAVAMRIQEPLDSAEVSA